jgi:hypothetical protein
MITAEQKAEIVQLYSKKLIPMIELSKRFNISRHYVWKILNKNNINTSKAIAAHINTNCFVCDKKINVVRCHYRKTLHNFCSRECFYKWLNRRDTINPLISNRHGMRLARKIISDIFDLQPEHIVHHEDRNDFNNNLSNLRVFKNQGDHVKYHRDFDIMPVFDGSKTHLQ